MESVKEWMCPEGSSVSFAEVDLRVGGTFRVDMHVNGADIVHTGTYCEIVPPKRLVFTWRSKNTRFRESLVTLEFLARGENTELVFLQTQLPDEEAVGWHTSGWTDLLNHLTASLRL